MNHWRETYPDDYDAFVNQGDAMTPPSKQPQSNRTYVPGPCQCEILLIEGPETAGAWVRYCPLHAQAQAMRDLLHRAFYKSSMGCPACLKEPCRHDCLGPEARALLAAING